MGLATTLATLGAVLLLLGVVGGGFTYLGATMPRVGRIMRAVCFVLGGVMLLCAIAVGLLNNQGNRIQPLTDPTHAPTPAPQQPIFFVINDHLTEGASSESIAISFEGHDVGTITVTAQQPDASLTVTNDTGGTYPYMLDATIDYIDANGGLQTATTFGRGSVSVADGMDFNVVLHTSSGASTISLESVQ